MQISDTAAVKTDSYLAYKFDMEAVHNSPDNLKTYLGKLAYQLIHNNYLGQGMAMRNEDNGNPSGQFVMEANQYTIDWYGTAGRQPLTIKMLKELSQSLHVSKTHSTHDRLMLQAALAVAFFGFLRVSKFTVNSWKRKAMRRGRFLAKQDVLLAPYNLQLTIKYSKMDQLGKGSIITMRLTRSSLLSCPRHAILLKHPEVESHSYGHNLCCPLWYNGSHPIRPTMVPLQAISIFNRNHNFQPEHRSQLQQLRDQVCMQTPMSTSIYHPPSHNLKQSQFLYDCRDAHRTPFQCPYEGPFKVMQAGDKIFTTDRGGQKEFISVDRLKHAFVDFEHPVVVSEPKNRGSPPNKGHPLVPTQPQEWTEIPDLCHPRNQIRRGKWRQPSKARWYTEEDEPAGQDGIQNEDEPAGQDGTQSKDEPAGQDGTQNEDEPAGQDGTQNEDEPAGQDGTQSKDEPAGQDGTQNEDEPAGQDGTQSKDEPAGQDEYGPRPAQLRLPAGSDPTEALQSTIDLGKPLASIRGSATQAAKATAPALMANVDLMSAFHMVPVRPDNWNLLGPAWSGSLPELSSSNAGLVRQPWCPGSNGQTGKPCIYLDLPRHHPGHSPSGTTPTSRQAQTDLTDSHQLAGTSHSPKEGATLFDREVSICCSSNTSRVPLLLVAVPAVIMAST
eukprot:Em0001g2599a